MTRQLVEATLSKYARAHLSALDSGNGVNFILIYTKVDLTGRETFFPTASTKVTTERTQLNTELTNGRGAKWSPKVVSSPFSTLLRYRFSICPICPICRPRVVVFLDSKQKQEIARSLPNILSYLNLQIRPLQTLKQQTFFLLGSGLRIELFLPALQPNRRIEKRPWRLYWQATLVQSHKVKPVLT